MTTILLVVLAFYAGLAFGFVVGAMMRAAKCADIETGIEEDVI